MINFLTTFIVIFVIIIIHMTEKTSFFNFEIKGFKSEKKSKE